MAAVKGRMAVGARITVPAAFRRAMGATKGDALVMELLGDELRVRSARSALRRIRGRLKTYAPAPGEKLVSDKLIEERRRQTANA